MSALEILKQALELEPSNDDIIKCFEETKLEIEEDTSLPADHPERVRFENMLKWLAGGGSKFDKLKIRFYTPDYRGVHAAKDIKKGEVILFVPKD